MSKYKGMKPYRGNTTKAIFYTLITLVMLAFPMLFIFPEIPASLGIDLGKHVLVAYLMIVSAVLLFSVFVWLRYRPNKMPDWYREAIKWINRHLEETLSMSSLKREDGDTIYIPKVVRDGNVYPLFRTKWYATEVGPGFELYDLTGDKAFEDFAGVVTKQLPKGFECKYLETFDSKARYVISFRSTNLPVREADE